MSDSAQYLSAFRALRGGDFVTAFETLLSVILDPAEFDKSEFDKDAPLWIDAVKRAIDQRDPNVIAVLHRVIPQMVDALLPNDNLAHSRPSIIGPATLRTALELHGMHEKLSQTFLETQEMAKSKTQTTEPAQVAPTDTAASAATDTPPATPTAAAQPHDDPSNKDKSS